MTITTVICTQVKGPDHRETEGVPPYEIRFVSAFSSCRDLDHCLSLSRCRSYFERDSRPRSLHHFLRSEELESGDPFCSMVKYSRFVEVSPSTVHPVATEWSLRRDKWADRWQSSCKPSDPPALGCEVTSVSEGIDWNRDSRLFRAIEASSDRSLDRLSTEYFDVEERVFRWAAISDRCRCFDHVLRTSLRPRHPTHLEDSEIRFQRNADPSVWQSSNRSSQIDAREVSRIVSIPDRWISPGNAWNSELVRRDIVRCHRSMTKSSEKKKETTWRLIYLYRREKMISERNSLSIDEPFVRNRFVRVCIEDRVLSSHNDLNGNEVSFHDYLPLPGSHWTSKLATFWIICRIVTVGDHALSKISCFTSPEVW